MALTKVGKEGITGISNSSDATAITIDSSENVGIGCANGDITSDGNASRTYVTIQGAGNRGRLNLGCTASNGADTATLGFTNGANTVASIGCDSDSGSQTAGNIFFATAGSVRATLDSSGSLLLGTSSKGGSEKLALIGGPAFNMAHASTGTVGVFRTSGISGSIVGSISVSGSATAFNTSSDYRLKENVSDMTGAIDRVKELAPKRFNFIADADTTVDGFLAHEAQAIVPEAISGTKDETREVNNAVLSSDGRLLCEDITQAKWTAGKQATEKDGETIPAIYPSDSTWSAKHTEPVMQGIDQSKLVPLLTGALQEAIAKIETLETEMTALKARVTALEA